MFSLLFSTSFWYDVLAIIAVIGVIYMLIKFPHAKIYVFTILFALITISGLYSIININSYYSASGGIYGVLSGNLNDNNLLYVSEKTFELQNTTLVQVHDDTYHAKTISNEVFKIESGEHLGVFVNGSPCTYSKIEEDYFVAYYTYSFYGRDDDFLFKDTLKMYFAFYDNATQLEVITEGGSQAVKYWGYYFNNNNFNVTLKSVNTSYDKNLTMGEGDTTNYAVVKYYLDDIEVAKQVCLKGSTIEFPKLDENKIYKWKLKDSETYINSTYVVTGELEVYGEWSINPYFVEKTWNGLGDINLSSSFVWLDGDNVYCSDDENQYVLDKSTDTWEEKIWNGFSRLMGHLIWSDGENIYYSNVSLQYILIQEEI